MFFLQNTRVVKMFTAKSNQGSQKKTKKIQVMCCCFCLFWKQEQRNLWKKTQTPKNQLCFLVGLSLSVCCFGKLKKGPRFGPWLAHGCGTLRVIWTGMWGWVERVWSKRSKIGLRGGLVIPLVFPDVPWGSPIFNGFGWECLTNWDVIPLSLP